MVRLLIYLKHHAKLLWAIIDLINGSLFYIFFRKKMEETLYTFFELNKNFSSKLLFKRLVPGDLLYLQNLYFSQNKNDLQYFNPHSFDLKSLEKQIKNPAFLMMGVFDKDRMVGYFFLRFFINKKCFVGRLIDKQYRGRGIGRYMNEIMYNIAWSMEFRCLSTISRNNELVMKAHSKNPYMKILKQLDNDYLLVEFVRESGKV